MRLTLDIDPRTAARLNEAAQNAGLSSAEWIVRLIERNTLPEWPPSVKSLVGAWRGESDHVHRPSGAIYGLPGYNA